jgi:hypothetical protein
MDRSYAGSGKVKLDLKYRFGLTGIFFCSLVATSDFRTLYRAITVFIPVKCQTKCSQMLIFECLVIFYNELGSHSVRGMFMRQLYPIRSLSHYLFALIMIKSNAH